MLVRSQYCVRGMAGRLENVAASYGLLASVLKPGRPLTRSRYKAWNEETAALPPHDTLATAYLTTATAVAAGFTLLWAATSRSRRDLVNSRPVSDAGAQILERKYCSP